MKRVKKTSKSSHLISASLLPVLMASTNITQADVPAFLEKNPGELFVDGVKLAFSGSTNHPWFNGTSWMKAGAKSLATSLDEMGSAITRIHTGMNLGQKVFIPSALASIAIFTSSSISGGSPLFSSLAPLSVPLFLGVVPLATGVYHGLASLVYGGAGLVQLGIGMPLFAGQVALGAGEMLLGVGAKAGEGTFHLIKWTKDHPKTALALLGAGAFAYQNPQLVQDLLVQGGTLAIEGIQRAGKLAVEGVQVASPILGNVFSQATPLFQKGVGMLAGATSLMSTAALGMMSYPSGKKTW